MFLISQAANAVAKRLSFSAAMRGVQVLLRAQGIGIGADIMRSGEQGVFDLISSPAPILFDVGGHVGEYSRAFLRRFPQGEVFLFEPSSAHISRAQRALTGNAHFFDVALSDREQTALLYKDTEVTAMASLTRRDLN